MQRVRQLAKSAKPARQSDAAGKSGRVLLIDYNDELAQVMTALLEDTGLEVINHTCPPDSCCCDEALLATQPDAVVVDLVAPVGNRDNVQGWQCLQNLAEQAAHLGIAVVGFSLFDSFMLRELGIEPTKLGVRVLDSVSNPADFADQIATNLDNRQVA